MVSNAFNKIILTRRIVICWNNGIIPIELNLDLYMRMKAQPELQKKYEKNFSCKYLILNSNKQANFHFCTNRNRKINLYNLCLCMNCRRNTPPKQSAPGVSLLTKGTNVFTIAIELYN